MLGFDHKTLYFKVEDTNQQYVIVRLTVFTKQYISQTLNLTHFTDFLALLSVINNSWANVF